jgi:hypothetical protein
MCLMAGAAVASPAQTPQKIIDEYLQAQGGAKALAHVQAQTIAGNLSEESTGKTGSWSLIAHAPDRLYMEIIAGSDRSVEAYNGMSAWGEDSSAGLHTLTGTAATQTEATAQYWNDRLTDVRRSKIGLQLAGIEKVHGGDAYRIQARLGSGVTCDIFFDTKTHLITREILPAGQFDYDDYRLVQGVQTPYRIELHSGGHDYKIAVTRADFSSVDDSLFNFPHTATTPLPDMATLMREVTRNQKAVEEMQKQYTCHVTEEQETTARGRTATAIREYEVFNIAGDEVRHLIAKDGKPLEGSEKKKEDERFNKEFEKQTKAEAETAKDPRKRQKQEEKDEAQISDFLRAVRFTNARRERFRGQDVIAVDFGPNPDYKPKKTIDNVIHQLAGVVWIDEQARDVARLEAHFSSNVRIVGGVVASLEKGSAFVFEQAKVNEEVWLPTYDEVHIAGRFLILKVKANQIDRYTDYKKFKAESKFTPE